jgi:hypothetical protein
MAELLRLAFIERRAFLGNPQLEHSRAKKRAGCAKKAASVSNRA